MPISFQIHRSAIDDPSSPFDPSNPFKNDVDDDVTTDEVHISHFAESAVKKSLEKEVDVKPLSTNPFENTLASAAMMTVPPPFCSAPIAVSLSNTTRVKRRRMALWVGVSVLLVSLLVLGLVLMFVFYMTPPTGSENMMAQRSELGTRFRGATVPTAPPETPDSEMMASPPSDFVYNDEDEIDKDTLTSASLVVVEEEDSSPPSSSSPSVISTPEHSVDVKWLLGGIDVVALQKAPTSPKESIMGDASKYVVALERFGFSAAFVSKSNADVFWLHPETYLPAFGGYSVWRLCSSYTFDKPEVVEYEIYNSRLVLFSNAREKMLFARAREDCWVVAEQIYNDRIRMIDPKHNTWSW